MTMAVRRAGTQDEAAPTQFVLADQGFAQSLGVRLLQGQNFTREEVEAAYQNPRGIDAYEGAVLLTQALADAVFPKGDSLGQILELPEAPGRYRVVGVLDKFHKPTGGPIDDRAVIFPLPAGDVSGMSFLVRTQPGQRDAVAADLEKAMLAVSDGRNVRVRTIQEIRKRFHTDDRLLVASLNTVMGLLLLVTALGIIGLTSFSVAERRRQIGTRRALGATRGAIVRHFLLENWLIVTSGAVLGLALAFALNYGLVTWIEGTKLDLRMLGLGVVALWVLGFLSTLGPALRAAAVPPAIATRNV
jgi:putative ABC transport system permease protein